MSCGAKIIASRLRSLLLIFEDSQAEKGYLKLRSEAVALYTGVTNFVWICIGMLMWLHRTLEYESERQALVNAPGYLQWIVFFASVGLTLFMIALCTMSLIQWCWPRMSASAFEYCVAVMLFAIELSVALSNPFFTARVFGEDVESNSSVSPEYQSEKDSFTMLLCYAVAVTTHAPQSPRWAMLIPADLLLLIMSTMLLSSTPTADRMGHISRAYKSIVFLFLLGLSSYSKHVSEQRERADVTRIANEKMARCDAEFRLESVLSEGAQVNESRMAETPQLALEVKSESTTTHSGFGFTSIDRMDVTGERNTSESSWHSVGDPEVSGRWLIPSEQVTIGSKSVILGHGASSLVVQGFFFGAPVAIKVARHKADAAACISTFRSITHDIRMLRRLRHPNIVSFFGVSFPKDVRELVLVLEKAGGMVLDDLLSSRSIRDVERCKILLDVASALRYLHSQEPSIVHGDLKSSNVIVDTCSGGPLAKLIDFGLSRLLKGNVCSLVENSRSMATEVICCSSCLPSTATDVFSFGRLAFFIVSGRKPLSDISRVEIERRTTKEEDMKLDWPPLTPLMEKSKPTVDLCVSVQAEFRPTMSLVQLEAWRWLTLACGEEQGSNQLFGGLAGVTSPQEDFVKVLDDMRDEIGRRDAAALEVSPSQNVVNSDGSLRNFPGPVTMSM